jgi:hypothetical protein
MDRRLREYYLVSFSYLSYDLRMNDLKVCVPSLKRSQNKMSGIYKDFQHLLSCNKKHTESMEYELRKMKRRDNMNGQWVKL